MCRPDLLRPVTNEKEVVACGQTVPLQDLARARLHTRRKPSCPAPGSPPWRTAPWAAPSPHPTSTPPNPATPDSRGTGTRRPPTWSLSTRGQARRRSAGYHQENGDAPTLQSKRPHGTPLHRRARWRSDGGHPENGEVTTLPTLPTLPKQPTCQVILTTGHLP